MEFYDESENDSEYSDDSQEDPNFDALEETRLTFSNLSLKKKSKTRIVKGKDDNEEEERSDVIEMVMPVLDEEDQKSYENIQKIIEAGQVEKLKVEQCKIYLRKHGLRLSGNKETLILRIKEHIDIVNGGGEKKYPASSFVLNCKGDACMGDVVMFEQNVYEVFNIASRSANGPPCGTRVVAGRIVKESYGAAKQQHTFTIEVLWSKGEKPLPPLHQLLIKGRNLYRLRTMRQKWDDEGERQKMLSEKHARGGIARLSREARIQQREMRKLNKPTRAYRDEHTNGKQEMGKREFLQSLPTKPEKLKNTHEEQDSKQKMHSYNTTCNWNIPIQPENLNGRPNIIPNTNTLLEGICHQMQPLNSINCSFGRGQGTSLQSVNFVGSSMSRPTRGKFYEEQNTNHFTARSTVRGQYCQSNFPPLERRSFKENQRCNNSMRSPLRGFGHRNIGGETNANLNRPIYSQQNRVYHKPEQKQACRYFVQGRCHFGDRCKYSHELAPDKL